MKCIRLLMTVSRFPLIVAVTVTVKGKPAVAECGAVKFKTACVVPQPEFATARPTYSVQMPTRDLRLAGRQRSAG